MPYHGLPEHLRAKGKEEINEDPGRVEEDLVHIKEWLKKQPHIKARTDDQWLLCFLRGCKFSLERTKEKLDMFYTLRTMIPEFFQDRDPRRPEIQAVLKKGVIIPLVHSKDPMAPRVILLRNGIYDPSEMSIVDVFKTNMMLMDISMLEDDGSSYVNGMQIIQDMSGMQLGHMASPSITKRAMACFQEAYPNRVKGIHFFNTPSFFETIFGVVRPFLTEKMKNRINVHGSNMDSLYKQVPLELLPNEYGGQGGSIEDIKQSCIQKMESYRDWFLEDAQYRTEEKKRIGKPKTTDELFGIEGSFRKLTVD